MMGKLLKKPVVSCFKVRNRGFHRGQKTAIDLSQRGGSLQVETRNQDYPNMKHVTLNHGNVGTECCTTVLSFI